MEINKWLMVYCLSCRKNVKGVACQKWNPYVIPNLQDLLFLWAIFFMKEFCWVTFLTSPCRCLTLELYWRSTSLPRFFLHLSTFDLWPYWSVKEEKRSMCWPWNRYHHYFLSLLFSLLYKGQLFWPLQLHLIAASICFLSLSWCLSVSLSVISSFSPGPVSPHMCIWQCALNVYLFISFCHISFCLLYPRFIPSLSDHSVQWCMHSCSWQSARKTCVFFTNPLLTMWLASPFSFLWDLEFLQPRCVWQVYRITLKFMVR